MGDWIIIIILALIWIVIFQLFRFLRQEMIFTGLVAVILFPLASLPYAIGSFPWLELLFLWFASGLAATLFHALIGIDYHNLKPVKRDSDTNIWFLRLTGLMIFFSWLSMALMLVVGLSVSVSILIAAAASSAIIVSMRHDLALDSFMSGLLLTVLVLFISLVSYSLPGEQALFSFVQPMNHFLGIPTDLLIVSFAIGLFLGPLYEFSRKYKLHDAR